MQKTVIKSMGKIVGIYGVITAIYYAGCLYLQKRNADHYYKLATSFCEKKEEES